MSILEDSAVRYSIIAGHQIPLWLKVAYTLFVCSLIPIYWKQYGAGNFLWFSDIALLTTTVTLWLESPLLASMMVLSVGLLELVWNLDFFFRLLTGVSIAGLSAYMFDPKLSLAIRALSLFHVLLPILLFWLLYKLGYDRRALVAQTVFAWIVLLSSYLFTDRSANVNWVHGFGLTPRPRIPAPIYLALLMISLPILVYLPTHLLLKKIAG
jgi:hypothetical protein